METYYRPLPLPHESLATGAMPLAGGPYWFAHLIAETRAGHKEIVRATAVPDDILERLSAPRAPTAGLDLSHTVVMGILNVTPDSFSDGGRFFDAQNALTQAKHMAKSGARLIDIGGESTRPGAKTIPEAEEIARIKGPVEATVAHSHVPVSIDTRKAAVAEAALKAGAAIVNDVSGFTYDPRLAPLCAKEGVPVCVMHAQGDPQTMQDNPQYEDVRFDVYDFLHDRVEHLVRLGLPRTNIIVDPGIGFGKTLTHNLTLLRDISLFHGLGCPILLGASRKKFIGTLTGADTADTRMPGSVSVALHAASQGVQIIRVHDVVETCQALSMWRAVEFGEL